MAPSGPRGHRAPALGRRAAPSRTADQWGLRGSCCTKPASQVHQKKKKKKNQNTKQKKNNPKKLKKNLIFKITRIFFEKSPSAGTNRRRSLPATRRFCGGSPQQSPKPRAGGRGAGAARAAAARPLAAARPATGGSAPRPRERALLPAAAARGERVN